MEQIDCLKATKRYMVEAGLTPILIASTLLGIYRDKKILGMPELGFFYEDFDLNILFKLKEIATREGIDFGIQKNDQLEPIAILKFNFPGIGIEMHPFYFYEDKAYINLCDCKCLVWPKRTLDKANLTKINFADEEWLAPTCIEEFLATQYGDWKTPQSSSWPSAPNLNKLIVTKTLEFCNKL